MNIDTDALLDRFLRYVRIDTRADEFAETYPSSPGQRVLSELLARELRELGASDVEITGESIVYATVPASAGVAGSAPVVAWFAHVDTSPETSGTDVKPQVVRDYDGDDIVLPGDPSKVLRPSENPDLAELVGKTIITTDGTTLLGADDKAGVAVIMSAVAFLLNNPDVPRGRIRVCFTCDEEIGHGVDHVDLDRLGARFGYTLDGAGTGEIEAENFSADKAVVTITGVNIHPSIGKGRMVNAVRLAGAFLDRLPNARLSPETTEGREGFLHPYQIEGGVPEVKLHFLLRDFRTEALAEQADLLRSVGRLLEAEFPAASVRIETRPQYRNMADGMSKEPDAVPMAFEAMRRAGLEPVMPPLRGGTDGAMLTAMGLPCPNLSTGEHNPHSPLEWTCLEEMGTAVRVLVELAKLSAEAGRG